MACAQSVDNGYVFDRINALCVASVDLPTIFKLNTEDDVRHIKWILSAIRSLRGHILKYTGMTYLTQF